MRATRLVTLLVLWSAIMLTACTAGPVENSLPATEIVGPTATTPEMILRSTPSATAAAEEAVIIPVTGDLNPARLSNLLHFLVYNSGGEQIGEVRDIIMDLDASTVAYVVVSSGGFLNVNEKQVAVPWSALQVQAGTGDATAGFFTLSADENLFVNAPEIDLESALPEVGQVAGDWDQEIRAYWGLGAEPAAQQPAATTSPNSGQFPGTLQPTPEGMPLSGIILASEALGFDFKLQGQQPIDVSIDDMIIHVQTGKILYVVIHTNFENAREQWVPIPYSLLNWDLARQAFILNVDMVTLQGAPFYIDNTYPDTTRPGWDDTYVFYWKEHGLISRP